MEDRIEYLKKVYAKISASHINSTNTSSVSSNTMLMQRMKQYHSKHDYSELDNTVETRIAGGIDPSPISGCLGHGSASSGFINTTLHGSSSDITVSVYDC
jgi:hypothetical protein